MRDYMELSCTPAAEDCEQLGPNYNPQRAKAECRAFINQLRREFGPEPGTAQLRIKSNSHDFGTYVEVACYYDDRDEAAQEYAYKCEGEMPENWDAEALIELGLPARV